MDTKRIRQGSTLPNAAILDAGERREMGPQSGARILGYA